VVNNVVLVTSVTPVVIVTQYGTGSSSEIMFKVFHTSPIEGMFPLKFTDSGLFSPWQ
jgi:hypothetical protein